MKRNVLSAEIGIDGRKTMNQFYCSKCGRFKGHLNTCDCHKKELEK